jgi:hypothetical protein
MLNAEMKTGIIVRRGGTPRTEIGRMRKAQRFSVERIEGDFRRYGCSRALLRAWDDCSRAFWIHDPSKWEVAP